MRTACALLLMVAAVGATSLRGEKYYPANELDLLDSDKNGAAGMARFAAVLDKASPEDEHTKQIGMIHDLLDQITERLHGNMKKANETHSSNLQRQEGVYQAAVAEAQSNFQTALSAAEKMTVNQTKAVASVQKNLADAKLNVDELKKKMDTLKEEKAKQEAALAAAEGVLKTKMDDADIIRQGAEKSFNTTKTTLMESYKDAVGEHKKSLDKKLELFSEEKQLVELIRLKIRELGSHGEQRAAKAKAGKAL